ELNQGSCCVDRYVLAWGDIESPFTVTGLDATHNYQIVGFEFNQVGGAIKYNKQLSFTVSGGNRLDLITPASESTPTTAYTVTSVLTKEDSIIITGIAGNGTNRAVLMAENKEVDDFFVDDQSYSAGAFGLGDQIG